MHGVIGYCNDASLSRAHDDGRPASLARQRRRREEEEEAATATQHKKTRQRRRSDPIQAASTHYTHLLPLAASPWAMPSWRCRQH